ncbi:MAG: hypothetical protein LIO91_11280 [Bacteroidales bacterium]|nr:hypothetical protein [Bacteroidales bacterium]
MRRIKLSRDEKRAMRMLADGDLSLMDASFQSTLRSLEGKGLVKIIYWECGGICAINWNWKDSPNWN